MDMTAEGEGNMSYRHTAVLLGAALALSLGMAGSVIAAPIATQYGTAVIDGNVGEWGAAEWIAMPDNYDGNPTDIPEAAYAARWTSTKVYMAVKVRDTAHHFTDAYDGWNTRDGVELYIHTIGSGGDYGVLQEPAQEWAVGLKTAADGSVWSTVGYPPAFGDYNPPADVFLAAGSIDGEWLYYEAAMTPYEYFGGRSGNPSVVSPLSLGQVIGLDATAVGHDGTSYTGMKCANMMTGKAGNIAQFAEHELVPEPSSILALATGLGGLLFIRRRRA